eukprot:354394-Rhodomonas_salina.2
MRRRKGQGETKESVHPDVGGLDVVFALEERPHAGMRDLHLAQPRWPQQQPRAHRRLSLAVSSEAPLAAGRDSPQNRKDSRPHTHTHSRHRGSHLNVEGCRVEVEGLREERPCLQLSQRHRLALSLTLLLLSPTLLLLSPTPLLSRSDSLPSLSPFLSASDLLSLRLRISSPLTRPLPLPLAPLANTLRLLVSLSSSLAFSTLLIFHLSLDRALALFTSFLSAFFFLYIASHGLELVSEAVVLGLQRSHARLKLSHALCLPAPEPRPAFETPPDIKQKNNEFLLHILRRSGFRQFGSGMWHNLERLSGGVLAWSSAVELRPQASAAS